MELSKLSQYFPSEETVTLIESDVTESAISRAVVRSLLDSETQRFIAKHPKSGEAHAQARGALLNGVPLNWMSRWCTPYPVYLASAAGCRLRDIDGNDYVDFCLGDTAALFGHGHEAVARALAEQAAGGTSTMMPTSDAATVAGLLAEWFSLPVWQFTVSATDANRFALRLARAITGRHKVLVFNGCYHGNLVETMVTMRNGVAVPSGEMVGAEIDPRDTTRIAEFNDLDAVEHELSQGDVACILAEPALTNCGTVLPQPGFHDRLRALATRHHALLILDETHTICRGQGGYTRAQGLVPDMVTLGKVLAGGVPAGAFGMSAEVRDRVAALMTSTGTGIFGIGGTLSGNALTLRAMAAMLEHVMIAPNYERMHASAAAIEQGLRSLFSKREIPWHVVRIGARLAWGYSPVPPRSARDTKIAADPELDKLLHLFLLNRGLLATPFTNASLVSPAISEVEIAAHIECFELFVDAVF